MDCDFARGQILLIDKPQGWTSFDVVAKIRNLITKHTGQKVKVGHAGTLDPMATGLLIIATGKSTKKLNELQGLDKEYVATVRLGAETPTYDADSEIVRTFSTGHLTDELVRGAVQAFIGKMMQMPPEFSAKRIKGKRAYELARAGKKVELKPVEVEFKEIEILSLNLPEQLTVRLKVSKGTYIRSFARDLGRKLNTGAYLTGLRRTKIGDYSVDDALTLEQFETLISQCSKIKNQEV